MIMVGQEQSSRTGGRTDWQTLEPQDVARILAAILDYVADTVIVTDAMGSIRYANHAAARILGWQPQRLIGQNLEVLLPDRHKECYRAGLVRLREASHLSHLTDVTVEAGTRREDGQEATVELALHPVQGNNGDLYFLAIVRDRTENAYREQFLQEEEREQELKRRVTDRTAALEERMKVLETFIHTVSHELRQPLTVLKGFGGLLTRVLKTTSLPPGTLEYVEGINTNTARLHRTLDDLLAYSRLGKVHTERERVNVEQEIASLLRDMQEELAEATIEVHGALPPIFASRVRVREVFANLFYNSALYTRPGVPAHIVISGEARGEMCRFSVADNGIGIPIEYRRAVFDIFRRLPEAVERRQEGTGIGLAIVKRIIEEHGGEISIMDNEGQGTVFHFTLPQQDVNQHEP